MVRYHQSATRLLHRTRPVRVLCLRLKPGAVSRTIDQHGGRQHTFPPPITYRAIVRMRLLRRPLVNSPGLSRVRMSILCRSITSATGTAARIQLGTDAFLCVLSKPLYDKSPHYLLSVLKSWFATTDRDLMIAIAVCVNVGTAVLYLDTHNSGVALVGPGGGRCDAASTLGNGRRC